MCNCGGLEIVFESPAPVKTGWSICLPIHDTWVQTHAYHPAPVKTGYGLCCHFKTWVQTHAYHPAPVKTGLRNLPKIIK